MRAIGTFVVVSFLAVGMACGQALVSAAPSAVTPGTTVNADRTITFRLMAPGAKTVQVVTDAMNATIPMTQDANGLWSATTPALTPEHYGYTFLVDGVHILDPRNKEVHPNYVDLYSDVLVPATPPAPWELTDIPHGDVTTHSFATHIGLNYPDNQTAYVVYTPPGYDAKRKGGYPVLYLLHGFSDSEEGWTRAGKAELMMDSMLHDGKIVPMIVVMPRGYGDFDAVKRKPAANAHNVELFDRTLVEEIIPMVEKSYNVAPGKFNRAVAGLSMGGQEAVTVGLQHPEMFAWVGGMSAGLNARTDYDKLFPSLDVKKADLKLLWVACGTEDGLITANRALVAWATKKGLPVKAVETPGWHTFIVWRSNLLALAPLLFRK